MEDQSSSTEASQGSAVEIVDKTIFESLRNGKNECGGNPACKNDILKNIISYIGTYDMRLLYSFALSSLLWLALWLREKTLVEKSREERNCLSRKLADYQFRLENAEQSNEMLSHELQRKMKQILELKATAVGSVCNKEDSTIQAFHGLGEETQPYQAGLSYDSIETILAESNAIAVQNEQVDRWLCLERNFDDIQENLTRLRSILFQPLKMSNREIIEETKFTIDSLLTRYGTNDTRSDSG